MKGPPQGVVLLGPGMWGRDLEEMAGGEASGGSWAVFGRGLTCHVLDLSQDQRRRCCETVGPGDEALPGLPAGDGAAGGVRALRVPRQSERAGQPFPSHTSALHWGVVES